jgi:hypothetical protein
MNYIMFFGYLISMNIILDSDKLFFSELKIYHANYYLIISSIFKKKESNSIKKLLFRIILKYYVTLVT